MADYNVQMKQYNGTSFDNILPYASQALTLAGGGGVTEIIAQARAGLSQIATGSYVGNGAYSLTITTGFKPKFVLVQATDYKPSSLASITVYIERFLYSLSLGMFGMEGIDSILVCSPYSNHVRGYIYQRWTMNETSATVKLYTESSKWDSYKNSGMICNESDKTYSFIAIG